MSTIIIFLAVLSIIVFAHELGHFWTARKLGVKAEEFGFGFPPRIGGIYKDLNGKWKYVRGNKEVKDAPGTVYSINWLLLGGFVKIKGENGEGENEKDSFASRPAWHRFFILSAGVSMNIILAACLISIGFMFGLPQVLGDDLGIGAHVIDERVQIMQVLSESPAEKAGLKMGDIVLSANGEQFSNDQKLQNFVAQKEGQELNYKIKRGDNEINFVVIPEIIEETGSAGIGIAIVSTGLVKYPFFIAIWEGIKTTIYLTLAIIIAFYELFKGLIFGQGLSAEVAGPIGIASLTGQFARMGFVYLLQFTALLSINLAIINFLPFPALDGGRVLFIAIEKIKGSPVKQEIESAIHNIGFILLMILILAVTFNDVAKFGNIFKALWERVGG